MSVAQEEAERVTSHLAAEVPAITGVCLFGSVARGDDARGSDIDLLVVGTDRTLTPAALRSALPRALRQDAISFAYHTPETLESYLSRWPRFMVHLRREGRVLLDRNGVLGRALARDVPMSTLTELRVQLKHLGNYDHLERFGGNFLFCLAHLARVGRAVVFALLAEREVFEFVRDRAFVRLTEELPEAAPDVRAVAELQPFHEHVTRRGDRSPPYSPHGCDEEVAAGRDAIRRLILRSRHADELTR